MVFVVDSRESQPYVNVALNQPVTSNSIYSNSQLSSLVDGNNHMDTDTCFDLSPVTSTTEVVTYPWVQVDLGVPTYVFGVSLSVLTTYNG